MYYKKYTLFVKLQCCDIVVCANLDRIKKNCMNKSSLVKSCANGSSQVCRMIGIHYD